MAEDARRGQAAAIGKHGTGARSAGKQLRRVGDLWA